MKKKLHLSRKVLNPRALEQYEILMKKYKEKTVSGKVLNLKPSAQYEILMKKSYIYQEKFLILEL